MKLLRFELPFDLSDLMIVAGIVGIGYGSWRLSEPAGFIVCGALVAGLGYLIGRRPTARGG